MKEKMSLTLSMSEDRDYTPEGVETGRHWKGGIRVMADGAMEVKEWAWKNWLVGVVFGGLVGDACGDCWVCSLKFS